MDHIPAWTFLINFYGFSKSEKSLRAKISIKSDKFGGVFFKKWSFLETLRKTQ
jgi:hypothetical protein